MVGRSSGAVSQKCRDALDNHALCFVRVEAKADIEKLGVSGCQINMDQQINFHK